MTQTASRLPRHFFLVDDDDDDREIFSETLFELSSTIVLTRFKNGVDLMKILSDTMSHPPEVIFLDLRMPLKTGFECLAEIRSLPVPIRNLNIVILSGADQPTLIASAFDLGATFYAIKPNSFPEFKSFLTDVVQMDWLSPTVQKDKQSAYLISPLEPLL